MADPTPTAPTKPSPIAIVLTLTAAALAGVQVSPALDALPSWVSQFVNIAIIVLAAVGTKLHVDAHKTPDRSPQAGVTRFDVAFVLAGTAGAALAFLLAMHLTGCATLKTMTGDFAVCAKADLGQLVKNEEGQLVPLATAIAELVEGNPTDLETQALALITQVGVDAVDCAKVAYEDTHPTTGSGSAVSAIAPKPGLARIDAVIAAKRSKK